MAALKDMYAGLNGDDVVAGCFTTDKNKQQVGLDICAKCPAYKYWCYERIRMAFQGYMICWVKPRKEMRK